MPSPEFSPKQILEIEQGDLFESLNMPSNGATPEQLDTLAMQSDTHLEELISLCKLLGAPYFHEDFFLDTDKHCTVKWLGYGNPGISVDDGYPEENETSYSLPEVDNFEATISEQSLIAAMQLKVRYAKTPGDIVELEMEVMEAFKEAPIFENVPEEKVERGALNLMSLGMEDIDGVKVYVVPTADSFTIQFFLIPEEGKKEFTITWGKTSYEADLIYHTVSLNTEDRTLTRDFTKADVAIISHFLPNILDWCIKVASADLKDRD